MTHHRHERSNTGSPGDQQQRPANIDGPDEIAADGTAEFELVTDGKLVHQIRRDLAALEALNRELELIRVFGRRRNRVRPLGAISVGRGEPDIDMLSRSMARPAWHGERQRLHARSVLNAPGEPFPASSSVPPVALLGA